MLHKYILIISALFLPLNTCLASENINIFYGDDISKDIVNMTRDAINNSNQFILSEKENEYTNSKEELFLVLGKEALSKIAKSDVRGGILTILVDKSAFTEMRGVKDIYAIYSDPNIDKQRILIDKIFGVDKIIHRFFINDSDIEESSRVINHKIENADDVEKIVRSLDVNSVILLTPNIQVINRKNYRNILISSYRRGITIIGYTKGMVKAGAVATVYHTVETYIKESLDWFAEKKDKNLYANKSELVINHPVLKSLQLDIGDESSIKKSLDTQRK